jgi:Protein of unknown function (DUF3768)
MNIAPDSSHKRTERIAQLNDLARKAMGVACTVLVTPGFLALETADQSCVRELVETFNKFSTDNDPYGERDFGAVYQCTDGRWSTERPASGERERVFWKLDYYDHDLKYGSEDPADPRKTRRVLTIMLAEEY